MFTDDERKIFRLAREGREVAVDPMVAWRNLYRALDGSDLEPILADAQSDFPEQRLEAMGKIAHLARAAFGLRALDDDGNGDTEAHAAATLYGFFAWEADLKNAPGRTPSGPSPSDSSPAPSTTRPTTASG